MILTFMSTKKKKKNKLYFGPEVQEKIVQYQNESNKQTRDLLYEKDIYPAFNSLVQSLVAVYKFKSSNEDISHLKADCVSFLFETINKWDASKGTKAFSYFNVVAKRWLTIHSRRLLKLQKRSVYIDDEKGLSYQEKSFIYEKEYVSSADLLEFHKEKFKKIINMIDYVESQIKDENDIKCCFAIKKIFNDIDNIDFFNKRAVFVYLREISGLNSSELSSSLSSIRKIYRKVVGPDKQFDLFN